MHINKTRKALPSSLCTLACILFLFTASVNAEKTLTLTTGEWNPYSTRIPIADRYSNKHYAYGLVVDIISATLIDMKKDFKYEFQQWSDIEKKIGSGEINLVFPYSKSKKREQNYFFSEPLISTDVALYFNVHQLLNIPAINNPNDFKEYSVIVMEGYEYTDSLKQAFNIARKTIKKNNELEAIKALIDSRENKNNNEKRILPLQVRVGDALLERYFKDDRHKIDRIVVRFIPPVDIHLMASRKNPANEQFIANFNRHLQNIKNNGLHAAVSSKYQHVREKEFEIRLKGTSSYPLIMGYQNQGDKKGFLIPNGTRVAVREWDESFTIADRFDSSKELELKSKVIILEGPLKNRELWVPNLFLSY